MRLFVFYQEFILKPTSTQKYVAKLSEVRQMLNGNTIGLGSSTIYSYYGTTNIFGCCLNYDGKTTNS